MGARVKSVFWRMVTTVGYGPRIKHYRGHSVHSPLVYSLIREVFVKRHLDPAADNSLYLDLLSCGVSKYYAVRIQNMYDYCKWDTYTFVNATQSAEDNVLSLVSPSVTSDELERILDRVHNKNSAVCVLSPASDRQKALVCRKYTDKNVCLSIDKRGFLIFFFGQPLTKKHFKL